MKGKKDGKSKWSKNLHPDHSLSVRGLNAEEKEERVGRLLEEGVSFL